MAWVYGALFAAFVVLASVFIALAGRLSQAGISRPVFFLVLVPVGLGSAAFLERALRARSAEAKGKLNSLFGQVQFRLGGSVAVFALVVGGGVAVMSSQPSSGPLQLVVRVRAETPDEVPRGSLTLNAGVFSSRREIPPDGEIVFASLPDIRGKPIELVAQAPGYAAVDGQPRSFPESGVIVFSLRKVAPVTLVTGTVLTRDRQPVAGALVDFERGLVRTRTDDLGYFRAELPRAPGTSVLVMVLVDKRIGHQGYYTTPNELTLVFKP
jgi:hypothetical protein